MHCCHKKLEEKRWSHLTPRQPERLGEDLYRFYFSHKLASTHLKIYPRLYLRISDTSIYTLKYCVYILLFYFNYYFLQKSCWCMSKSIFVSLGREFEQRFTNKNSNDENDCLKLVLIDCQTIFYNYSF